MMDGPEHGSHTGEERGGQKMEMCWKKKEAEREGLNKQTEKTEE